MTMHAMPNPNGFSSICTHYLPWHKARTRCLTLLIIAIFVRQTVNPAGIPLSPHTALL